MYALAVANQKGGTGKTISCAALGSFLSSAGYRVLYVDLDSQCNLSRMMTAEDTDKTAYEVLAEGLSANKAIYAAKNGSILPSDRRLSVLSTKGRPDLRTLKTALESVKTAYDVAIIDTPPALGYMSLYALYAADGVLVPMHPDRYSTDGFVAMNETLAGIRQQRAEVGIPGKLSLLGVVLTEFNQRATLHKSIYDMMAKQTASLKTKLYTVRRTVAVDEWQYTSEIDTTSTAGADYQRITEQIITDMKLKRGK